MFVLPVSADSHSQHGRLPFVHRDERANKTHERLQKKLKERQGGGGSGGGAGGGGGGGGGGQIKDSPPASPQKSRSTPPVQDIHNGVGGKGLEPEQGHPSTIVTGTGKQKGRGKETDSGGRRAKGQ